MTDVIGFPVVKEEVLRGTSQQSIVVHLFKYNHETSSTDVNRIEVEDVKENEKSNEVVIGKVCGSLSNELVSNGYELNKNNSQNRITCDEVQEKYVDKNINDSSHSELYNHVKKESDVAEKSYFPEFEIKKKTDNIDIKSSLTCPYCQKNFETVTSLDKHKEIHLGSWPFMCRICHKGFPFHHLLLSHIAFHKTDTFPCYNCNKIYLSRYKLKAHMKTHINQFVCRICKQAFSTKDCLKSHRIIHKKAVVKKQIYICNICSAKFPISVELKSHLRMHTNDWPFSCEVCKKLYRRRGSFLTHRSKCLGLNPYNCDICKKSFIRQCHFIQHVKQIHNGVRPFSCDTCNKRFNSKSNLEIHSQVHSTRLSTIYKCSLCQQMFKTSRKLRGHKIREHSLYRPYKCSTCKKIFIFKSQLSNHSKEHKIKEM